MMRIWQKGELGTVREGAAGLPLVSICIPTYNRPDYLRAAVDSCLAQTYKNIEIIVTDNTEDFPSWPHMPIPRITYLWNEGNIGPCASAKKAVSMAQGKYIKLLMDDDLLKPRAIELMVSALEKNQTAGIAAAPMDIIDGQGKRIFPRFYLFRKMRHRYRYEVGDCGIHNERVMEDFLTRDYPCCITSGILFRADALREAGPFSDEYGFAGDLEMCMRVMSRWTLEYIDEVLSSWRLTRDCHTASMHRTGLDPRLYYKVAEEILHHRAVMWMFQGRWNAVHKKAMLFCSARAALNFIPAIRNLSAPMIFDTLETIVANDQYPSNWLRLPFYLFAQAFACGDSRPPPRGDK